MASTDIILESCRAIVLLVLVVYLWRFGKKKNFIVTSGWRFIQYGFLLILFGSFLDITDNFESLNPYIVIGDTETEAFLEKVVGYLAGFVFLTIGLKRWGPTVERMMKEVAERKEAETALLEHQDNLKKLVEERTRELQQAQHLAKVGSWTLDQKTNSLFWSNEIYRIFKLSPQHFDATYEAFLDAVHPDDRDSVNQAYTESLESKQPYQIIHRLLLSDGQTKWVEERGETQYDEQGKPIMSRGTVQDITERKLMEEELRQHAVVFKQSHEAILITDESCRIIQVNQAFTDITGYLIEEALGNTPRLIRSERHDDAFYDEFYTTLERDGKWQGEFWNRRKNGEVFPVWSTVTAVKGIDGKVSQYISIFSDISEKKQTEEYIRHFAYHDVLTDLPNRMLFNELCRHALAQAKRNSSHVAVLFLDLDGFKLINDKFGHPIGDELLQLVAVQLIEHVRAGDTVARLGGDEFTVILEAVSTSEVASAVARKIIDALNRPFEIQGHQPSIGTSIGISVFPEDGQDVITLVKNADKAMYRAKDLGRNCYVFFSA